MKNETLKRINKTIVSYLSIVGLSDNKKDIDANNPVFAYFTNLIYYSGKGENFIEMIGKLSNLENVDRKEVSSFLDLEKLPLIPVNTEWFHLIVKELYDVYKKIDKIQNNPNEEIKNMLVNFIGSDYEYNKYISDIVNNYKESFYELLRYYNSNKVEYNNIKIQILYDKMMEYAEEEEYEQAAELKNKITEIKENIL